jgi:hypothetical protein
MINDQEALEHIRRACVVFYEMAAVSPYGRTSAVVGFFVLFAQVFDACGAVVAVADDAEVFEDDSENEPDSCKKELDAFGDRGEKFH